MHLTAEKNQRLFYSLIHELAVMQSTSMSHQQFDCCYMGELISIDYNIVLDFIVVFSGFTLLSLFLKLGRMVVKRFFLFLYIMHLTAEKIRSWSTV